MLRTRPALWPLLVAIGCGWYAFEVLVARTPLVYFGEPQVQGWRMPLTWNRTLRNHGFLVGYSDLRGNPLWVAYRLTPSPAQTPHLPRPDRFHSDWRSITLVGHDDYRGSGYDRGHMAPNHAISLLYGRDAQWDTFLMTNIVPQKPALNRKLWERLEEVELDHFTQRQGTVWVLSGPIFDSQKDRLRSAWRVEIPDAFYKIYAAPRDQAPPLMLAFITPQTVRGDEPLDRYVVSVDRVEQLTGLDFFPELPVRAASQVEADVDAAPWDLAAVAQQPSRYDTRKRLDYHGVKPH